MSANLGVIVKLGDLLVRAGAVFCETVFLISAVVVPLIAAARLELVLGGMLGGEGGGGRRRRDGRRPVRLLLA